MHKESDLAPLFSAILKLENSDELLKFFTDLCTPAELKAMSDRWQTAQLIEDGLPYRQIYEKTGVSTATVTRVARSLEYGEGYRLVFNKIRKKAKNAVK